MDHGPVTMHLVEAVRIAQDYTRGRQPISSINVGYLTPFVMLTTGHLEHVQHNI